MARSLTVSIVTHFSDIGLLDKTFSSLKHAVEKSLDDSQLHKFTLILIDNSIDNMYQRRCLELKNKYQCSLFQIESLALEKNLGFGHAHNHILKSIESDYHLILNPDVIIDKNAISYAIDFMNKNVDIGLLTPNALNQDGEKLFLTKRYPSLLLLFFRGFFPTLLKKRLKEKSDYYEMRDINQNHLNKNIKISSGCFMFFRTTELVDKFRFNEKFFLYFEDFDLSWRFSKRKKIAYVPDVRIIHFGGKAGKKGWYHAFLFIRSAITFFNLHGWKLY